MPTESDLTARLNTLLDYATRTVGDADAFAREQAPLVVIDYLRTQLN